MIGHRRLLIGVLLLAAAGCTTSAPHVPAHQLLRSITAEAASSRTCGVKEVKTAIVGLFGAWNHREPAAFGRLFDPTGAFAFPGKHQDTLTQGPNGYTEVGGRSAITALAEQQWAQGEFLMYRDVVAVPGGGPEGGGGATVVARFPDGTTQPMDEAKFIYDCATRAFAHVVMTSAMAARHNARPWSWRMP